MVTKRLSYTVEACGLSDVGLVRDNNEDAWAVDPKENIFILADGMGGHSAGEIASNEAVETLGFLIKQSFGVKSGSKNLYEIQDHFYEIIQETNLAIYKKSHEKEEWRGMGTTLCCVYFHSDYAVLAHIGDSRIYRHRRGDLALFTQDHSLVCELLELGELNERQAREYAHRNIITKALGTEPVIDPVVSECDLEDGDIVMMCSDGLTDHLTHAKIEAILNIEIPLEETAKQLIDAANQRGGQDNITVVLMKVQPNDEATNLS